MPPSIDSQSSATPIETLVHPNAARIATEPPIVPAMVQSAG